MGCVKAYQSLALLSTYYQALGLGGRNGVQLVNSPATSQLPKRMPEILIPGSRNSVPYCKNFGNPVNGGPKFNYYNWQ